MASVKIKKLTKRFGNIVAVNNLNLRVKDKELVVLLGPSGCGKTTTLRCIAGLERQDEGDIYIGNVLVNDLPPWERDIAMVFQSYALYPHMTCYENIAFPLKMRRLSKLEIDKKVNEVAELLQIKELLERKPAELSGGQKQRVALGRAIVRDPKVFLMDEPLSNLDAKLRVLMRIELKNIQRDLGVTTIYVTHDQVEAMTMADRIVVLKDGKIQQFSTPDDIYQHPKNHFVAGFVGSPPMNFLDCSFIEKKGSGYLVGDGFELRLDKPMSRLIQDSGESELILGIRPEDVSIHPKKGQKNIFVGEFEAIEKLGNESILHLKFGKNAIRILISEPFDSVPRKKIKFYINEQKIHLFSSRGDKRAIL